MPYIKQEYRERALNNPENPGELNYAITMRAIEYLCLSVDLNKFRIETDDLIKRYIYNTKINYSILNAIMGVLECIKYEFNRRIKDDTLFCYIVEEIEVIQCNFYGNIIAPYEDQKIKENGNVFPKELMEKDDADIS